MCPDGSPPIACGAAFESRFWHTPFGLRVIFYVWQGFVNQCLIKSKVPPRVAAKSMRRYVRIPVLAYTLRAKGRI